MIDLYFGLPGCGKTTYLAYLAKINIKRGKTVYTNVLLNVPGVRWITPSVIGKKGLYNCVLLLDEATLIAHNRDFKNYDKDMIEFFLYHRHYKCNICLFAQAPDTLDKRIREVINRTYYLHKSRVLPFTYITKIPYGLVFPEGERKGSITLGYSSLSFFEKLMYTRIFIRPKYYKYFDTHSMAHLTEAVEGEDYEVYKKN